MARPTPFVPAMLLPCCKQSMVDIRERMRLGSILQALSATSGLLNLLGNGPIDTLVGLTTTDWSLFAKAAKNNVAKDYCKLIAWGEIGKRPGGPLNEFWEHLYDALNE